MVKTTYLTTSARGEAALCGAFHRSPRLLLSSVTISLPESVPQPLSSEIAWLCCDPHGSMNGSLSRPRHKVVRAGP